VFTIAQPRGFGAIQIPIFEFACVYEREDQGPKAKRTRHHVPKDCDMASVQKIYGQALTGKSHKWRKWA
jgi:hypothetical protein